MLIKYFKIIVFSVLILFFNMIPGNSQGQKNIEYRLKAAYIFNFLQFVEWPQSAFENESSPIILAVLGEDPFGKILDETVQSEKIGSHPILIKRFHSLNELGFCHLLYVSSSEKEEIHAILKRTGNVPVLTISDIDGFSGQGGNINFYKENNKIRFEINMKAVKQADLKVSSKLLRLAKIINPI